MSLLQTIFCFIFINVFAISVCELSLDPALLENFVEFDGLDDIDSLSEFYAYEPILDLKAVEAVEKPGCQSFDGTGNILLNGRVRILDSFNVNMLPTSESHISVVFCRQHSRANCRNGSLTMCFNSDMAETFPQPSERRFRDLAEKCGVLNGLSVSTMESANGELFQVNTRHGNSYTFRVPSQNCFILWLWYESDSAKTNRQYHNPVHSLAVSNEITHLNGSASPLEFSEMAEYFAVDLKNKPIVMQWKEVLVRPIKNDDIAKVPFKAIGGGSCCALTGRMMGRHISKCYRKWVNVGDLCQPSYPGHSVECQFPHAFGNISIIKETFSNFSLDSRNITTGNATSEKFSHLKYDESNEKISKDIQVKTVDKFVHEVNTSEHIHQETILSWKIMISGKFLFFKGKIGPISGEKIFINGTGPPITDFSREVTMKMLSAHATRYTENPMIATEDSLTKVFTENAYTLEYAHTRRFTDTQVSMDGWDDHDNARVVVEWPYSLVKKELRTICNGKEKVEKVAIFTNLPQTLELVRNKEIEFGYPDPSVYDNCPFT